MKLDFHPASDAAMYVLFDPAAMPDLLAPEAWRKEGIGNWVDATYEEAKRGNIWVYDDNIDGDPHVRVYVDEEPEIRLGRLAQNHLRDSLLHVPSGRIFCMGGEYVNTAQQPYTTPETYLPKEGYLGSEGRIPPGEYHLSAFEVDWEQGDVENKIREHMGEEYAAVLDRDGNRMGVGCLVTAGAVIAGVIAWYNTATWQNFGVALAVLAVVLVVMWWWITGRGQAKEVQEAYQRREAALADWPGIVIVLHRLEKYTVPEKFAVARMGPNAGYRNPDRSQVPKESPWKVSLEVIGCLAYYTAIAFVCLIFIVLGMAGWHWLMR